MGGGCCNRRPSRAGGEARAGSRIRRSETRGRRGTGRGT
jgi:hypothetical protein